MGTPGVILWFMGVTNYLLSAPDPPSSLYRASFGLPCEVGARETWKLLPQTGSGFRASGEAGRIATIILS